jgi:hypothetical protein
VDRTREKYLAPIPWASLWILSRSTQHPYPLPTLTHGLQGPYLSPPIEVHLCVAPLLHRPSTEWLHTLAHPYHKWARNPSEWQKMLSGVGSQHHTAPHEQPKIRYSNPSQDHDSNSFGGKYRWTIGGTIFLRAGFFYAFLYNVIHGGKFWGIVGDGLSQPHDLRVAAIPR